MSLIEKYNLCAETGRATVGSSLLGAAAFLERRGVGTPRLDAELLLAEARGSDRLRLLLDADESVPAEVGRKFAELVERRGRREPLQYILGRSEFRSLDFEVCPDVLIPRPETEILVETAVEEARRRTGQPLIVEVGCGSGNVAVSLAVEVPSARVVAVDVSPAASAMTARAAARHGVEARVTVVCCDVFGALSEGLGADLIVSNPPYVESSALALLEPEVGRFEPRGALDGGEDGLAVVGRLLRGAGRWLKPDGALILEAGFGQAERIAEMAAAAGWRPPRVTNDLSGHPRIHLLERS